ncbi:MAG: hypothetical protein ACM3ZF_06995, partial [Mycobacterium leprae]
MDDSSPSGQPQAASVVPSTGQTLLILGATGDLTARLLLPGLAGLLATGDVQDLSLVGSGRESVLNAEHVDSVDIVFDETLALEGRAGYYDGAGALVDMIQ